MIFSKSTWTYLLLFGLFVFINSASINAQSSCATTVQYDQGQDSIVLLKTKSQKRFVIPFGQKLKLTVGRDQHFIGDFISINNESITVMTKDAEKSVPLKEIKRLKILSKPFARILGGILTTVGTGGILFGAISLFVGIIGLITASLGAILLVAVPFLAGGGFGLFKLGDAISGKRFSLKSKWKIINNQ